jgi:hypothetical protein
MYGPDEDDRRPPPTQAEWMRDVHTEYSLLGLGCPWDCCDPMAQYEGMEEEAEAAQEADAHAAFRARVEAARAEAIATGRTVTLR